MTTQAWSSSSDHQNDAGFRAWGSDFAAKLLAVGMVQTADTGQINWTTVTRPGTNTDGGYEIWKFNDALQSTAPIFIRFNYGTGGVATRPRIQMIVGTSSNGSGTIGGTALTGTLATSAATGTSTGSSFTNYMCHTAGVFWFVWQAGGPTAGLSRASAAINRTVDSDGAPTAIGALVTSMNGATSIAAVGSFVNLRFAATAAVFTETASAAVCCIIPAPTGITGTLTGGSPQAFLFWTWTPQVIPVLMAAVYSAELAETATFNATLVGTTSRTFLVMGKEIGVQWTAQTAGNYNLALIWE